MLKRLITNSESDQSKGIWYFDGKPHKCLSILGLNSLPQTGHLSLERSLMEFWLCLGMSAAELEEVGCSEVEAAARIAKNMLLSDNRC